MPAPKPPKPVKSKPAKQQSTEAEVNDDDEEEIIRCICGNTNPKDKRAFIGCDACTVWQHNVCMGVTDNEDQLEDHMHYYCEECGPAEHQETLQALARGEKIWETRNKIYQNEKRMSKSRRKDNTPGWLRKDVPAEAAESTPPSTDTVAKDAGNKRKREDVKNEQDPPVEPDQKTTRSGRQDKRRKSSTVEGDAPPDTEVSLVEISQLPADRQKIAQALSKIISDDIQQKMKSGFVIPQGENAKSLGDHHASRIEYALHMNHGGPKEAPYAAQFRTLNANLKKNQVLIERLLNGSLTADELSTMSSSDMASEELQRERAVMKEALDRQAIAIAEEGPRYRQDHKGYQLIEDETQHLRSAPPPDPPPAADRDNGAAGAAGHGSPGSPTKLIQQPLTVDTSRQVDPDSGRRPSSQQFDISNIWAKTAQSPSATMPPSGPRPGQMHARRTSSIPLTPAQQNGAKDDPDIDRMLEDNDEPYSPADASGQDVIVWRGKLMQSNEDEAPTVNARFVAGRDLSSTVSWQQLLPDTLSIDGRLQTQKAEDYLCGLRWSSSSDVAVLSLTPYDNAEAFNNVFNYFQSRQRYAVVEKNKPPMVKDLYIIPVEIGSKLPDHVEMLEHCTLKKPVEERFLLATFVVARAPESLPATQDGEISTQLQSASMNDRLSQQMRQSMSGPAGSPLNNQNPQFSPPNTAHAFPPNPYGAPASQQPAPYPSPQPHPNPKVNEILGELQFAPTAQAVLQADPNLSAEKLTNLRIILSENVNTRTDFTALAVKLGV